MHIFLRLMGESAEWLKVDDSQQILKGPLLERLDEVAPQIGDSSVTVLINSFDILLTQANVPDTSTSRLRQAIPFSLEDELSENVDDLHFALSDESNAPPQAVAVINRNHLSSVLELLKQVNIRPDKIIPDVLALPHHEGFWHILIEDNMAIVRSGRYSGFACKQDSLQTLVEIQLQQFENHKPESIYVVDMSQSTLALPENIAGIKLNKETSKQSSLVYLAKSVTQVPTINLLQSDFKSQHRNTESQKYWRYAGILALTFFVMLLGRKFTEVSYLSWQSNRIEKKIAKIYFEVFPKAKQVTSPRIRMQQAVKKIQEERAGGQLFGILGSAGDIVRQMKFIKITALNFRDDKLRVTVTAKEFSQLDTLTNALKKANLKVKQENAASRGDAVTAEYLIEENVL